MFKGSFEPFFNEMKKFLSKPKKFTIIKSKEIKSGFPKFDQKEKTINETKYFTIPEIS